MLFWRLIPLNATLFVVFSAWFLVSPTIQHTRYISEGKRPITSDSRFTPSLPSDSTLLLPSQLYSSLRAFLCPGFSTARKTADPPYLRVITRRITFGSALWTGQTEECRLRPDTRELLSQTSSRTCASLPSLPCATSHWDPIQLSRWDGTVSSAPSYGLNISHTSPPPSQEPHFPFKCQNLKYSVCINDMWTVFTPPCERIYEISGGQQTRNSSFAIKLQQIICQMYNPTVYC